MKKQLFCLFLWIFGYVIAWAGEDPIGGKIVYKDDHVVFHQLDEHTWIGTGNLMFNESLYLLEGDQRAILLDAGTKIPGLKKIVESITDKPVTLIATHVHPDHTGSAVNEFPEIYINAADTVNIDRCMPGYPGKVLYLKDGEVWDLGGRSVEVVFTPGHTPGSTTFVDKAAGYGFSGDAFGSGNLLLTTDFSTLIATCRKMAAKMESYGLRQLYPGHYYGKNAETLQRLKDLVTLSQDVLSGKVKGEPNPDQKLDLDLIVSDYGVRINYNSGRIK